MAFSDLPVVNAILNGLTAILLTAGYYFIRQRNKIAHRNCMVSAFIASVLFLICYITYLPRPVRTGTMWQEGIFEGLLVGSL